MNNLADFPIQYHNLCRFAKFYSKNSIVLMIKRIFPLKLTFMNFYL